MSGNWSVNLETEEYIENRNLIFEDAAKAITETTPGHYVNLAVAENHGSPDLYLIPELRKHFGSSIKIHFVDQCGCGGYVYRIHRLSTDETSPE